MSNNQFFHSQSPLSEELKPYISYYYFHRSEKDSAKFAFSFYPHYENALTINKNSRTDLMAPYHVRTVSGKPGYWLNYSQLFKYAAHAEMQSPFDRIGVVFKPLGINHFLDEDLGELMEGSFALNVDWFDKSFLTSLDPIFTESDLLRKVGLLDKLFLSALVHFKEQRLGEAIQLIMKHKGKIAVEELAKTIGVHRKTLLRLFKRHLNCSVKEYLGMVRFRHALHLYQDSMDKPSLSQLTYDADFNDQSEFIHHFKKVTGLNPRKFFKHLKTIGQQSTYWEIKNQ